VTKIVAPPPGDFVRIVRRPDSSYLALLRSGRIR
jgi:hypothetical protein